MVSLTRAVHHIPPGAAAAISETFARGLGATVEPVATDGGGCIVWFESGQSLVFVESSDVLVLSAGEAAASTTAWIYMESIRSFRAAFDACACQKADDGYDDAPSPPVDWGAAQSACAFCMRVPDTPTAPPVLWIEVRSVAHPDCPMPRKDRVAGGWQAPVAPAFANWPPLPPLPFPEKGIPRATGTFGESARALARRSDMR